jgi:integrase
MKNSMEGGSYWKETVRIGMQGVYVWEREERSGAIFIKFTSPKKSGRDRRVKMKLPGDFRVRDSRGNIDPKRVTKVVKKVIGFCTPLLLDEQPTGVRSIERPLTLDDGFDRLFDLEMGKWATDTLRKKEVRRAYQKLRRLVGGQKRWVEITSSDVRAIWRRLAREYKDGGCVKGACGMRQTEVTVDALYSTASWLRDMEALPSDSLLPMKKWRSNLKKEWEEIVGKNVQPSRPRHSAEEMRRLFACMHDSRVDPRFALAFDLGGEQRIGQVIRSFRSQLELTPIDATQIHTLHPGRLGLLRVIGKGFKTTAPIVLTGEQRAAIERAFTGYLSEYERLYREGTLDDYPLFPSRRLKEGKAIVHTEMQELTKDAALKMFHKLEAVAGVEPVEGRGWYGVRRQASDLAEDISSDDRVLNALTGHRNSATRRGVYQESERNATLTEAAQVRAALRRTVDTKTTLGVA